MGVVKIELWCLVLLEIEGDVLNVLFFFVISNSSVNLSCLKICIFCSWMSLWKSCLYCYLLSAQLCNLWLSRCWPNKEGDATNVFQSNRRGILSNLWSIFVGKYSGNGVVGVWLIFEGVEGSDMVSGSDKDVSDEISIWSFCWVSVGNTLGERLCHPMWETLCWSWGGGGGVKWIFMNFFGCGRGS